MYGTFDAKSKPGSFAKQAKPTPFFALMNFRDESEPKTTCQCSPLRVLTWILLADVEEDPAVESRYTRSLSLRMGFSYRDSSHCARTLDTARRVLPAGIQVQVRQAQRVINLHRQQLPPLHTSWHYVL